MNRFLKTLLLWLLAFALPVQGFAAVAKLSCGPIHQHGAAVTVSHADHSHAGAMSPHVGHDHAHHADMTVLAVGTGADDSTGTADKPVNGKCSACAACCVGVTILPTVSNWSPAVSDSSPAITPPPSIFSGYIPDGLKRPPKSLLV